METSPLFDGIRDEWIEQGIQQGKVEAKIEVAKNLLISGLNVDIVVSLAGLQYDEVHAIKVLLQAVNKVNRRFYQFSVLPQGRNGEKPR